MKRTFFFTIRWVLVILPLLLIDSCTGISKKEADSFSDETIDEAAKITGLSFTGEEEDLMRDGLTAQRKQYEALRKVHFSNAVPPAIRFNPLPQDFTPRYSTNLFTWKSPAVVKVPDNREDLAFYSVAQLSRLIRSRKVTSQELTKIYLNRLKKYDDSLHCVISLTEERAMVLAKRADDELSRGIYRGPLHGIPFGIKDLLSVPGYKTTWGANPYRDQKIDTLATVVRKLEDAGAVLVAKLSMGALAMGDVWFADTTRNPWDLRQGSSGSSAGPAAATSAGLVAFSIGTETLGSIVSPSTRCGVTGLRPTFGRVSRFGAMTLSWSMDKIGPICRTAEDCALVFHAIYGPDPKDPSTIDFPFHYEPIKDLQTLKVGYLKDDFENRDRNHHNDSLTLTILDSLGVKPVPVLLPASLPVNSMRIILNAEAAAAFDELTRSGRDSLLVRQDKWAWPNSFRKSRFIPAVEYIQANRLRQLLIQQMDTLMKHYDVIIAPTFGSNQLLITNLTGHPCIVVPNGFDEKGNPTSICFLGNLFDEGTLLQFAQEYQNATDFDEQHPPKFIPRKP
ncbi:MAG: amidase [Chlorobi bacterium]|nr:amidase [Chlorobiota bacterium]